jgi:hypothetical protein
MRHVLMAAIAAAAMGVAMPAQAALSVVTDACDKTLTTPDALACAGYYAGNLLNNSSTDQQNQIDALATIGGTFNGNFDALSAGGNVITSLSGAGSNQLNFGKALSGITYIGAHFGNVAGPAGNVSVFYKLNLAPGTTFITLDDTQGFSNAALYSTGGAVPEPGTWALMLLGFGGIGVSMRRRRRPGLAQLA